jgi:hypothetical protein
MKPIKMTPFIAAPKIGGAAPASLASMTLGSLCAMAGIPLRVHECSPKAVSLVRGDEHRLICGKIYVGVGSRWKGGRVAALRVLEVLAHSFHQYEARECVCHRGLFVAPGKLGRPLLGVRPKTARERMAAMRARRG